MEHDPRHMTVSSTWLQVAAITFLIGFTILGVLAYLVTTQHPPVPKQAVSPSGEVLFTEATVMAGQNLFQKLGLMQYGTIFGHGAYLGPDFTAQYLNLSIPLMRQSMMAAGATSDESAVRIQRELKANLYDAGSGTLRLTEAQTAAFKGMRQFYAGYFAEPAAQNGLRRPHIADPKQLDAISAYFGWAAWVTTTLRPNASYSYTNNWPPEPRAGNILTADAFLWSALSLIALLGGIGIVFFLFGKYDLLGWHASEADAAPGVHFRVPDQVRLTPSQRAVPWYFLVVSGLFLVQGLLGGANAHYHAEPSAFFGIDVASWFPYNLTRMWHLQLALFFVAASFLAMGIFITPMIAKREPKHQDKLAISLFIAVVLVVVGSLIGELVGMRDLLPGDSWFWIGAQGWEFLDLGRLWQILLTIGLAFWVAILWRGLAGRLRGEHMGNLPWLFFFSALTIPLFYAVGMVFGKNTNFAVMDFWRFWVVHLWVEDFLELFTTIMVAYVFVLLGVVRVAVATRVVYLDIILYSVGGVVGTMHHLYFSGAPSVHMSAGAFFSAMEVIPLVLLTYEAWRFMQLGASKGGSALDTSSANFPHKWAVMFLIAVGFWNFLGAGVFGFLINLPIVSYFEIGTAWTANHAHGAMMGVYGMLAMGFFMFVARYFIPHDRASERAMKWSFWSLNAGLAGMLFVNLLPLGALQMYDAVQNGYWHAREPEFFAQPAVRVLEWLRMPADLLFIIGGIVPIVYLALRMFANRRRAGEVPFETGVEAFTEEEAAGS